MHIFYSEYLKNYSTYTFGYAIYAVLNEKDSLTDAYNKGFLPFTGPSAYEKKSRSEIYYLARSLRIDLNSFSASSENRRILRKAEPFPMTISYDEKSAIIHDRSFQSFCMKYATERFRGGELDEQRWSYILERACGTHIFTFTGDDGKVLGYVLAGIDEKSVHYWYSFFDTDFMDNFPLGKYMMYKIIEWAKQENKSHIYLGTCYGNHSLYKVRDFKAVEYFEGDGWSNDVKRLKELCKSDDENRDRDLFKV